MATGSSSATASTSASYASPPSLAATTAACIPLRKLQRDALVEMLHLNSRKAASTAASMTASTLSSGTMQKDVALVDDIVWKVLVFDQSGQEIISACLKVNDLRECGVTVHMHINAERQPIPDVPAIYFLAPTAENVDRLISDIRRNLFESYYVNFTSSIPRTLLEELAQSAVQNNVYTSISQVYDQFLNFQTLERNLFSLNVPDSYRLLNDPTSSESVISKTISAIVDSLFSLFVTMGSVPVIRASRGNAAEMVASRLDAKLRDYLVDSARSTAAENSLFADRDVIRPLLVLVDRTVDLSSMLCHTWTYSSLVHDVLDMKLNRVVLNDPQTGRKPFDLDPLDFFWTKNANQPFPSVAEDVDAEINRYKKDVEEVTRNAGVSSLDQLDPNDFSSASRLLKSAIGQLPQLTERKRVIDMHMSIATALLKSIQERRLDRFFEAEEGVSKLTKPALMELLRDITLSEHDKIRLFLIYYLLLPADASISKEDMAEYMTALETSGCDTAPVSYIKSMRSLGRMMGAQGVAAATQNSQDLLGRFTNFGNKLTDQFKDGSLNLGTAYSSLISGVKNLIPSRKDLPLTRLVESLMDDGDDEFAGFDPKARKGAGISSTARGRGFAEAVVVVVGGGNYVEWGNINEWAARSRKRVAYGATEIITSKQFLTQLGKLAQ